MNIWQAFIGVIAGALTALAGLIGGMGIPGSWGLAIILFTLIIKLLTLPLTLQQLRASKAMQELQPELQKLQKKYKGDKEKLSQAQMQMYKEAGVNPLGGCLPMLVQMPIWFALYRALFQLAGDGVLNEGFLWIPNLAEPQGLGWLWDSFPPPFPFTPNVGWATAAAIMVLPILTVISQIAVQKMMATPSADPQQSSMNQMMLLMPFMFGFFAMQVPQGLALYWFTSNIFSLIQQYFITGWGTLRPAPAPAEASAAPASENPPDAKRTKEDGKRRKRKR
jgi:YidC/Oxa1 family membrane protein insertase